LKKLIYREKPFFSEHETYQELEKKEPEEI